MFVIAVISLHAFLGNCSPLPSLRGVNPNSASHYDRDSENFTCLDQSKSVPFHKVNDNYCDCLMDGSDEPGTSACYHGNFFCRNLGNEPRSLDSCFVDDGVCDCCDGSDESHVECPNTCLSKSEAERRLVQEKIDSIERSLAKKKELTLKGQEQHDAWSSRYKVINAELESQQALVQLAQEQVQEAEAFEQGEREKSSSNQDEAKMQESPETTRPAYTTAEASSRLKDEMSKLETLRQEKRMILRYYVGGSLFDFGPEGEFLILAGRCVEERNKRWIYELCFFDKATQSEPHAAKNRVDLGMWKGFEEGYSKAYFTGGNACPNGVPRSMTVHLLCSEEEKVTDGREPSMCAYEADFYTPLACGLQSLEKEKAHLKAIEQFEAEISAIMAAEKEGGAFDSHAVEL